jgi:hypothetical protein
MQKQILLPHAVMLWESLLALLFVPLFFFLSIALQYTFARGKGGEGDFLGQTYTNLLFTIPLGIISGVLPLLFGALAPITAPALSSLATVALSLYGLVVNIIQIQAAHRLNRAKATSVVFSSVVILVVLIFMIYVPFLLFFLMRLMN